MTSRLTTFPRFVPKHLHWLGVAQRASARIKRYSITTTGTFDPGPFHWIEHAAAQVIPPPSLDTGRPGLGFSIAHQNDDSAYLTLAWWDRHNELPLRIFVREGLTGRWRRALPGESFRVWDLCLFNFERRLWIDTMLTGGDVHQAAEAYLERHFSAPLIGRGCGQLQHDR